MTDAHSPRRRSTDNADAAGQNTVAVSQSLSALKGALQVAEEILLASNEKSAGLLRTRESAAAAALRKAQKDAAQVLLNVQSTSRELLARREGAAADSLLEAQAEAARVLTDVNSSLAESFRTRERLAAIDLLKRQEETARTLLELQSKIAQYLTAQETTAAIALLETQDEAARALLELQPKANTLLHSQREELESAVAAVLVLEQSARNRIEELASANAALEAANAAKSRFLAAMSHELRTPLNSILGFSGLLANGMVGVLQPEQQKQIEMISHSGKHLLRLVNEVLDLSAIESGYAKVDMTVCDVELVVLGIVESLSPLTTKAAGLELSFEIRPGAEHVFSDSTRLEQILFNLIGNAVKFTESGSVRVEVRRERDEIVFEICDSGRGIGEDELKLIFDEFYQVESTGVGRPEGTGIGLTVTKKLVALLGGTLVATSILGKGSELVLRLPAEG